MITSFVAAYTIVGYSILIPVIIFLVITSLFFLALIKADPEKTRRLLLRMELFISLSFFAAIFIFAFCIGIFWIDNDFIPELDFPTIAGTGAALLLTGFTFLALMTGIFALMIKKFDPGLFRVTMYSGYRAILRRQVYSYMQLLIFVTFFFSSSFLIGYYFENTDITVYFYTFVFLLYYIFYPTIVKFSGKAEKIREGEIYDGYMELLEKSHISHKRISIIQSPYGFANAMAMGFIPGFTEIILFKPLVENLNAQEVMAIIAHELAHIKRNHVLYRVISMLVYVFIIGKLYLIDNSSLFTIPAIIIFAIIYNSFVRKQEKEADTFAAELTSPEDLVSGLKKIDLTNRKARGELVEKSFFEKTGRRSPMDARCDDILKRFGREIEVRNDINADEVISSPE